MPQYDLGSGGTGIDRSVVLLFAGKFLKLLDFSLGAIIFRFNARA
jgi:hypothetical protein